MSPVQTEIEKRIQTRLSPTFFEVKNESANHKGHLNGPANDAAETHFHVKIVSPRFHGLSRIDRHRLVHNFLDDLLKTHIHALSLVLLDEGE